MVNIKERKITVIKNEVENITKLLNKECNITLPDYAQTLLMQRLEVILNEGMNISKEYFG